MPWSLKYALRRLFAKWQSLATMIVGVLLAAIVGSNAPLYTSAIAQVGWQQALPDQNPADLQMYIRTGIAPIDVEDFGAAWSELDSVVTAEAENTFAPFGDWFGGWISWAEMADHAIIAGVSRPRPPEIRLAYYDDLRDYIEVTEGEWVSDEGNTVSALISEANAEFLGISVGDVLTLKQQGWDTSQVFDVHIVGIITPKDTDSPYWFAPNPLGSSSAPILLTTANNLVAATQFTPTPTIQIGWRSLFWHGRLPYTSLPELKHVLDNFEPTLRRTLESVDLPFGPPVFTTGISPIIEGYIADVDLLNIPFGLLLLQLGVLVIFFLFIITALAWRAARREVALLQSRGAQNQQVLRLHALETFIICAIAALVAPFITRTVLAVLIPLLTGIESIPLDVTPTVFGYSVGTSIIAWVVLLLTLLPVLQLPLIAAGGSATRSRTRMWWQRYYLDWVLLIIGLVALVQLTQSQSLTTSGTTQSDPLLLIAPALLFVAFSSVLLRFFPFLVRLISGYAQRRRGAVGVLASWQVSREPLQYGQITFLLALAIGIGWFAISYQATLTNNQQEQAMYRTGGDVRIEVAPTADVITLEQTLRENEVIESVSQITRVLLRNVSINRSAGRGGREAGELLAVDSTALQSAQTWNSASDWFPPPLADDSEYGKPLPDNTAAVGVWLRIDTQQWINFGQFTVENYPQPYILSELGTVLLKLRNADGNLVDIEMTPDRAALDTFVEELEASQEEESQDFQPPTNPDDFEPRVFDYPNEGWLYFEAALPDISSWRIAGLTFLLRDQFPGGISETLISGWQAIDAEGQSTPLDIYAGWDLGNETSVVPPGIFISEEAPPIDDAPIIAFQWPTPDNSSFISFFLWANYPEIGTIEVGSPTTVIEEDDIIGIPVTIGRSFAELNDLSIGQRFRLSLGSFALWLEVHSIVDLFPTLYPETPYIIIDRDSLLYQFERIGYREGLQEEFWLILNDPAQAEEVVSSLPSDAIANVTTIESVRSQFDTDITSLGVIGLLYLSFLIGVTLSLISLITYLNLSAQARLSQFRVLLAMGMPSTQLTLMLILEQMLVLITALILGALIGQFMVSQVLPPLAVSAAGGSAVPPFRVQTDLVLLAQYLLVIVAGIVLVLVLQAIWLRGLSLGSNQRYEEE